MSCPVKDSDTRLPFTSTTSAVSSAQLDGLLWKGRRVAPDKIDEVETGQSFHKVARNVPLRTFTRLLWQESRASRFAEPGVILIVRDSGAVIGLAWDLGAGPGRSHSARGRPGDTGFFLQPRPARRPPLASTSLVMSRSAGDSFAHFSSPWHMSFSTFARVMDGFMGSGQEQAAGRGHEDALVGGQIVALLLDLLHEAAFKTGAIFQALARASI